MKKALLIALTLAVICVWAAPALAVDWIAFGGFTVKSMFYKNIDYRAPTLWGGFVGSDGAPFIPGAAGFEPGTGTGPGDHAWNKQNWWLQMRGNIYIVARASADLQGVFGIEVNSTRFGDSDTNPAMPGVGGGMAGRWNTDAIAIQVKSLYIDFKVPELPLRLKVGIQPYQLRNHVFLYVDAAGITGNLKIPAGDMVFNVNPFWAVMSKGGWSNPLTGVPSQTTVGLSSSDWTTADDSNFFGVDVNAVIGDIKPGLFFAMQRRQQLYDTATGEGDQDLWWLGAYVDAKFGGLVLQGDFIYNGGYDYWKRGTISPGQDGTVPPWEGFEYLGNPFSVRHEAWLARGEGSYTLNKFTFGLGGLYGTGDNFDTRDKNEGFMVPYRSEAGKFASDFLVLNGDWGYRQPYGTQNTGGLFRTWSTPNQGVWYVRAFADYAVTDWLKLKVNGGYIGDTCKGRFDQFGYDGNNDQSIGWELDAAVNINIYKNLYFDNAFGYLIAGKALASQGLIAGGGVGGFRGQDPWIFVSALTYVF